MLVINTNVASLQAQKNLTGAQFNLSKSIDHLSAGLRITSAADDATGLKSAVETQATVASLNACARSTQKGIADAQTAEGYLNEVSNILVRMAELTAGGDDGTSTEFTALATRLTQIDTMGGVKDVSATVGIDQNGTLETVSTTSGSWAVTGMTGTQADIDSVADMRADLGATANVLQNALGTIQTAIANNSAVVSAIQDVDVAEESSKLARSQVLAQAGVAALAQANQMPQMALKLLG
jgi:flagellin